MRLLMVNVVGIPAPQGSKRHVGRGILIESSKRVGPWRDAVVAHFSTHGQPITRIPGPVVVRIVFRIPRPRSHYTRTGLKPSARSAMPDKRPDLDKLVRSTLDALTTTTVIDDDARVVRITAAKRYTNLDEAPGCLIAISDASHEITDAETLGVTAIPDIFATVPDSPDEVSDAQTS